MALGVAFTPAEAALVLVDGTATDYVTLDTFTAELNLAANALLPDSYRQVMDEIMRIRAVLRADGRALACIGVAAEPQFSSTAAALIDALAELGIASSGPMLMPSEQMFAEVEPDNEFALLYPSDPRPGGRTGAHRRGAHERTDDDGAVAMGLAAAAEALREVDADGSGLGAHPRYPLLLAALAGAAALVVGIVGWMVLSGQAGQGVSPTQSTETGQASATTAPSTTSIASSTAAFPVTSPPVPAPTSPVTVATERAEVPSVAPPAAAPVPVENPPANPGARPDAGSPADSPAPAESPQSVPAQEPSPLPPPPASPPPTTQSAAPPPPPSTTDSPSPAPPTDTSSAASPPPASPSPPPASPSPAPPPA
jgi:hypothetical protein